MSPKGVLSSSFTVLEVVSLSCRRWRARSTVRCMVYRTRRTRLSQEPWRGFPRFTWGKSSNFSPKGRIGSVVSRSVSWFVFYLRFAFAYADRRHPGTCVALTIAQLLQKEGETVEILLMIDGSPTLFRRPKYVEQTRRRITDGTLQIDVRPFIHSSTPCANCVIHRIDYGRHQ